MSSQLGLSLGPAVMGPEEPCVSVLLGCVSPHPSCHPTAVLTGPTCGLPWASVANGGWFGRNCRRCGPSAGMRGDREEQR